MKNVPSLYSIKKWQEKIEKNVGHPIEKITSLAGNVFYMNDIGKAIAKVCEMIWSQAFTEKHNQPRIMQIHSHVMLCRTTHRMVGWGCHRCLMVKRCCQSSNLLLLCSVTHQIGLVLWT